MEAKAGSWGPGGLGFCLEPALEGPEALAPVRKLSELRKASGVCRMVALWQLGWRKVELKSSRFFPVGLVRAFGVVIY